MRAKGPGSDNGERFTDAKGDHESRHKLIAKFPGVKNGGSGGNDKTSRGGGYDGRSEATFALPTASIR